MARDCKSRAAEAISQFHNSKQIKTTIDSVSPIANIIGINLVRFLFSLFTDRHNRKLMIPIG